MRKVVVYELLSLDGVAESPDAFILDWDEVMDDHLAEVIATQDAVVLGRHSYDEWSRHWPTSDVEPFASFINEVDKHVATSTPPATPWPGSSVIDGDVVEFVRQLKTRDGGDIGVHASISLARALLAGGVVDELRLVVAPRIVGRGRRFLDDLPPLALESVGAVASPTGALLLHYRVLNA